MFFNGLLDSRLRGNDSVKSFRMDPKDDVTKAKIPKAKIPKKRYKGQQIIRGIIVYPINTAGMR